MIALAVGVAIGWLVGRRSVPPGSGPGGARSGPRPTRQQRHILAMLPPDPQLPTLEELVAEELEASGASKVPGVDRLAPGIALKVFTRDRERLPGVAVERLRYVVAPGVEASTATADQVHLEKADEGPSVHSPP